MKITHARMETRVLCYIVVKNRLYGLHEASGAILSVHLVKQNLNHIFSSFTSVFARWAICNNFKAPKPMYNHVKMCFWEYYRRKSPQTAQQLLFSPIFTYLGIISPKNMHTTNYLYMRCNGWEAGRICTWEPHPKQKVITKIKIS